MLDAVHGGTSIIAYLGIGFFIAGALLIGRYREALAVAERTRDGLKEDNERLLVRNALLETQPNLEQHAELLSALTATVIAHDQRMQNEARQAQGRDEAKLELLSEIRRAVVPPLR